MVLNIADMRTVHSRDAFAQLKERFGDEGLRDGHPLLDRLRGVGGEGGIDPRPPAGPGRGLPRARRRGAPARRAQGRPPQAQAAARRLNLPRPRRRAGRVGLVIRRPAPARPRRARRLRRLGRARPSARGGRRGADDAPAAERAEGGQRRLRARPAALADRTAAWRRRGCAPRPAGGALERARACGPSSAREGPRRASAGAAAGSRCWRPSCATAAPAGSPPPGRGWARPDSRCTWTARGARWPSAAAAACCGASASPWGARRHPTPIGRYAVTDRLLTGRSDSPYGCCALALSGHQTKLLAGLAGRRPARGPRDAAGREHRPCRVAGLRARRRPGAPALDDAARARRARRCSSPADHSSLTSAPWGSNGTCMTCAQPAVAGFSRCTTAPVAS